MCIRDRSWAPQKLIQVENPAVATNVKEVAGTLSGNPFTTLTAAQALSVNIWAVATLRLRPAARGIRNVPVTLDFAMYAPNGVRVKAFPGTRTTLDKNGRSWAYGSAILMKKTSQKSQIPLGRWTVRVLVNGQTLSTISFTITR